MSSGRSRKRRQVHGDHVQAVVQILAERAVLHHLQQVGVGRGDDADVDLDRAVIADALELALLQHAQHLHLQRHRHGAHFVEEERAPVGLLEPALAHRDGAGERAAHVAEELGVEQRFGNRADVDGDEAARDGAGWSDESRARPSPCRCRSRRVIRIVAAVGATVSIN